MKTNILSFLIDPADAKTKVLVSNLLDELRGFEGKTFREMMDEIDETNRHEVSEQRRKLREELAGYLAEGKEAVWPHDILPSEARQHLFSSVWERGLGFVAAEPDIFQPAPEEFYAAVAHRLSLAPRELQDLLYADVPEARLVVFPSDPVVMKTENVVGALNLRRLKIRLRRAVRISLTIPSLVEKGSPYTAILFALKRNRLMYDARSVGGSLLLTISGPDTLFEKSTVYGNRLASFTGSLWKHTQEGLTWTLEAELMERSHGEGNGDALRLLHLDSGMHRFFPHAADTGEEEFKSSDEAAFQQYFDHHHSEWDLHYEGTIIPLSGPEGNPAGFMIPDFVAHRSSDGRRILIEIIGFWKEDYLRRKIEKVGLIGDRPIILIVNKKLSADRSEFDHLAATPHVAVRFYSGRRELKAVSTEILNWMNGQTEVH